MDIRQLRYFISVLEAKSLNKASTLLHIAQPALSTQIRNLERELETKLLHRHARGVEPTTAGERFARHARQVLRQLDDMRTHLSGAPSGRVLLCIARSLPRIATAAIAERCRHELPNVQLTIVESWRQQVEAIRLAADLTLTFHPAQGSQFLWEPLVQDELILVSSAEDRQAPEEIDLCDAFRQTLILPSRPHYVRQFVDAAASSVGQDLMLAFEIDSFEATKELVARNIAKAILPIACVREEERKGQLRVTRIKNPQLFRTLHLVHSSRQERSTVVDSVCDLIRASIFECVDCKEFGWSKMPSAEAHLSIGLNGFRGFESSAAEHANGSSMSHQRKSNLGGVDFRQNS